MFFRFLLQKKRSLRRFGKVIIHLFCSISECSSLFSEIYDSRPAFCLLIDSAAIIFIKVFLKYVLEENTFRTAKLFHSFKKLWLFFDPFARLAESLRRQPRGWEAYKILKIKTEGVRHISMSKTHLPEATQTWVWVGLKSPATCF